LTERTKGVTREGKPYFHCKFRDQKRTVSCMIWQDGPWYASCEHDWRDGSFYKLRALYSEHDRYGPQIEIHNIRPVTQADRDEGFTVATLVDSSRFDSEQMLGELTKTINDEIKDEPLRGLVLLLLTRHGETLKRLPATEKNFYPFHGGWLEHVLSVTRNCLRLCDHYLAHYPDLQPPLNRDLVIAGAALHDIGRVLEWSPDSVTPQPTVAGRLFGHIALARDLIRDTAKEVVGLNPELLQLLEHVVMTHLSLPEWGSPRLPMIPEVLILHHADDLDAKMEMYVRCLSRDQHPGPFTARDPVLGKPLLKGRTV
jgi:3'-5' exoribonuclease